MSGIYQVYTMIINFLGFPDSAASGLPVAAATRIIGLCSECAVTVPVAVSSDSGPRQQPGGLSSTSIAA